MESCPKCGANLADNSRFCHVCGADLGKATTTQEFSVSAEDLTRKISELFHEGNVSKIIVKDEKGKAMLEIPVTAGVVGVLLAPWLAAAGVVAAFATKCTLVVVRKTEPPAASDESLIGPPVDDPQRYLRTRMAVAIAVVAAVALTSLGYLLYTSNVDRLSGCGGSARYRSWYQE